jgi:hypothetical protein
VVAEADSHGLSIILPPSHRLTQGSVFTCGAAEDYRGCTTYGLIITARCDAEQDKVQIYNYLPVVPLNDWLHRDGRGILAERLIAETLGQMKGVLKESGHALSILETEAPWSILEKLFPAGEKRASKARVRFERLCGLHDLAVRGASSLPTEAVSLEIASSAPHLKDGLIRELVHQRLAGYYFYDRIEPSGDNCGHVVLLREIRMMSRATAECLAGGLDAKQAEALRAVEPRVETSLRVGPDDFAMPIGIVSSPYLEHLMQTFAMLFGRIGLPDPSAAYIDALWGRQGSVKEKNE